MSLRITLEYTGDISALASALGDSAGLHARIAGEAENFVKERGRATAAAEHRSANRLGAAPTGHLADAYEAIEGVSDDRAAALLVPAASRLRAAFGPYVLTPKKAKYLTIPAHREAYGRRARELGDLFPMRVGPRKTLVLARRDEDRATAEVMYVLAARAAIPEDPGLIPFEALAEHAKDSAEAWLDETIEDNL